MVPTDPLPEQETTEVYLQIPLLAIGFTDESKFGVAIDADTTIQSMQGMTERQRILAVKAVEQAFTKFLSLMCGGRQ